MKRIIPIMLVVVLIAGVLSACGGTPLSQLFTSDRNVSSNTYDYLSCSGYMDGEALIMTAGDSPVYWNEYYYWMTVAVDNIAGEDGTVQNWSDTYAESYDMYGHELSYEEFVRYYAYDAVLMFRTIEQRFDKEGLSIEEGDIYTVQNFMEDNGLKSEEELDEQLAGLNMTRELFEYIETVSAKYYALLESVYGIQGANCPEEEVLAYADSAGYRQIKQILISPGGEGGTERDMARGEAEEILAQLQNLNGDELETAFDELVAEKSDDEELEKYKDGYLFRQGDLAEEIQSAVQQLEEYKLSGIIETERGFHIVLNLPINSDTVPYGGTDSMRYLTAYDRFDSIVSDWQAEVKVKYEDTFDKIAASKIFIA